MSDQGDENHSDASSNKLEVPYDIKTYLYNELNRLETFRDLNEYWRVKHLLSLDSENKET